MSTFQKQTSTIENAIEQFIHGGKNRAAICLVANKEEWYAWIPALEPSQKERLKHEENLMLALTSNREVFEAFNRIMVPVQRFYKREDKRVNP